MLTDVVSQSILTELARPTSDDILGESSSIGAHRLWGVGNRRVLVVTDSADYSWDRRRRRGFAQRSISRCNPRNSRHLPRLRAIPAASTACAAATFLTIAAALSALRRTASARDCSR